MTRAYHSINTRYNIHFNANEAYKLAMEQKEKALDDNLSDLIYIFPDNSDTTEVNQSVGQFTTTIDKATKAIKLHSIKVKPKRNPNRKNDKKYQEWLQQREFTPFMDQVWLLLAKAEFEEGNYLRAISTFLYITKIYSNKPDLVAESQLWIARAYTEMGWMYEAGNVLHKLEVSGGVPAKEREYYSMVKANYLIRNNEFEAALPYLKDAIKASKGIQKTRMKYLLGQIYAKLGDEANAEKAFASVSGIGTPYNYIFNAKLQQIQAAQSKTKQWAISSLSKMAKDVKNKEYLDQVYYVIGNVYLQEGDSTKAIDNYNKAIKESKRNGYDKAICQVKLGDIYFKKGDFVKAQPNYSEALGQIKKSHPDYQRVSHRAEVLDELVVHVKTVHEQDSLQHLARLPEEERLQIINKRIENLKKEEKELKKEEEFQARIEERNNRISSWGDLENQALFETPKSPTQKTTSQSPFYQQGDQAIFYFYNPQVVSQGKVAFQREWGNRKLEDNWRRRNKAKSGLFEDDAFHAQSDQMADSLSSDKDEIKDQILSEDKYSVDYYLEQLPFTDEAIESSNELIDNALFNMGLIYKDQLNDNSLSIDAFTTEISRFPNSPNIEEAYFQLFMIYMLLDDQSMMSEYRSKLLNEFPKGKYAASLAEPNYESNFRQMYKIQDSLYNVTYNAYLKGEVDLVKHNYQMMKTKYPLVNLMPKFAFLNALTYVQTKDIQGLGDQLVRLTEEYPKADVTPLATEILTKIKEGKMILSDGSPIIGFDWTQAYQNDSILLSKGNKPLQYSDTLAVPYMLQLMFKPKTIDRNELLYKVADYNFSNYVIQTFDIDFQTNNSFDILQINGFASFANVKSYINKAFAPNGLFHQLDSTVLIVPISIDNYTNVLPRLGFEEYISFFKEHFKDQLPQLIAYWNKENIGEIAETIQKSQLIEDDEEEQENDNQEEDVEVEHLDIQKLPKKGNEDVSQSLQIEKDNKEISVDDFLTKDQIESVGKVKEITDVVEDVLNNPVDGIKSLFSKYKNREKLTKEEKLELKEQKKLEKKKQAEIKTIEKSKQDSIKKIEKNKAITLAKAEKAIQDSINRVKINKQAEKKDEEIRREKLTKKAIEDKENLRKQKERERKEKEKAQQEKLKQKEKERKEKEKQAELRRKERNRNKK